MILCSFDGCEKPIRAKGLCITHYQQFRSAGGIASKNFCSFNDCDRPYYGSGLCGPHYSQRKRTGKLKPIKEPIRYDPVCSFDGCEKPQKQYGLCGGHKTQKQRGRELTAIKEKVLYDPICIFDGCLNLSATMGFCSGHYAQNRKGKELTQLKKVRSSSEIAEMDAMGVRQCKKCCKEHPLDAEHFYRSIAMRGGWSFWCKRCWRDQRLRDKYRMSIEDWELKFEAQGSRCAICYTTEPGGHGNWHTDHDHNCCSGKNTCGKCVRAILCNNCNITVGFIEKHPDIGQALAYVEFHNLKLSARKAG